jgi:hypothetical protein
VKVASAIHPNQDGESCDGLRRLALFWFSSSTTVWHSGDFAVSVLFSQLP